MHCGSPWDYTACELKDYVGFVLACNVLTRPSCGETGMGSEPRFSLASRAPRGSFPRGPVTHAYLYNVNALSGG